MPAEPIPTWKANISDWQKLSEKTVSLMLSQCEMALRESIDTANNISSRADKLLTILLTILTALIAYLSGIDWNCAITFLTALALVSLCFIAASLIFCYRNLRAYTVAVPGDYPTNIVRAEFLGDEFTSDEQYVNLCISICQNIQAKIDHNAGINFKRMKNNTWALRIICMLPIVLLCLSLLAPLVYYFGFPLLPKQ